MSRAGSGADGWTASAFRCEVSRQDRAQDAKRRTVTTQNQRL